MRKVLIRLALLGVVFCLPGRADAQVTGTKVKEADPKGIEPCCNIVAINVKQAIVTARETASGYTFRFKVVDKRLLASLKVGEKVWADFATKSIRLRKADSEPCCNIITTPGSPLRPPLHNPL